MSANVSLCKGSVCMRAKASMQRFCVYAGKGVYASKCVCVQRCLFVKVSMGATVSCVHGNNGVFACVYGSKYPTRLSQHSRVTKLCVCVCA